MLAAGIFFALSTSLCAQPPVELRLTDQPAEDQPLVPFAEPLPELPETIVSGRLNAFPAEPLPADTVITPNREPTPLNQTGSAVDVITSEYIDQISPRGGQTTVAEVLRGRLGVDVVRQGGPGGFSSVFLRGANSQQTKVLLDGIPLNDPSNAGRSFDFSTLTVDNIERIEVLRGPQSMIYGSDAIGGVINIITARGQGPLSVRARGFGGSFNTGQAALNVSGGDDVKYYSVTGSYFSTGGISATSARIGGVEHDGYNLGVGSGRVGYNLGESWNVDYVFRYTDARAEIDDFDFFSGLPFDNLIRKNKGNIFANRVQFSNWLLDGLIQHRVGLNLTDYHRVDTDPGFSPPQFDGQTRTVDYFASAQLTETNIISAGADYLHEDASSTTNPQVSQTVQGVWVQDQFEFFGRLFGTAGARWDDTSRAGPAQTYRVTGLARIDETGTGIHGSIGTGFRQPSLAENLFAFGNPDLKPERSKGWDAGVRQQIWGDAVAVDATYFRNDFRDLIVFNPLIPPFGQLDNVAAARSSGVELSLFVQVTPSLAANAAYTYDDTLSLDPRTPFFGQQLVRRPRNKLSLTFTQILLEETASITLQMLYVGTRLDLGPLDPLTFDSTLLTLDQYTTLNLAANWTPSDCCEVIFRLDNLTNTEYEEVNGFGAPGLGIYGGVNLLY